jgi:hypothetical protein
VRLISEIKNGGLGMPSTSSNIQKRRLIRASEHKRDTLIIKLEKTKHDLQKARLELVQARKGSR